MDRFNGGSYGNGGARVIMFHNSSAQWSPQLERVNGGSYGKSLHLTQWNDRVDGGSYGRALGLPQVSDRFDGGSTYGRPLSSQYWKAPSERVGGGSYRKAATRVLEINSLNQWKACLEASKQTNKLMVVYFTAIWCKPCKLLEPAINDMAAKFTDVDFIKIDTDKLVSVSAQYGIQTMPTFILMKNGKEVDKVSGVKKDELQMKVMKYRAQQAYY